jgi:hypothetical protein
MAKLPYARVLTELLILVGLAAGSGTARFQTLGISVGHRQGQSWPLPTPVPTADAEPTLTHD